MEFKEIAGYQGKYLISDTGAVYSTVCNMLKKPMVKKNGYLQVQLYRSGKYDKCYIHRLVAQAFITNPQNLSEVNHKDEDKTNNHVDNLEWCTHWYNMHYGTTQQRVLEKQDREPMHAASRRRVICYAINGERIKEYESMTEAAADTGARVSGIYSCCVGRYKQSGGYCWAYVHKTGRQRRIA